MRTLTFGTVGDVVFVVHTPGAPGEEEWNAYLAHCEAEKQRRPNAEVFFGLTITDGGAPTSAQRNRLRAVLEGSNVRASVLTDSLAVKGVVSLFGMFVRGIEVFGAADWQKAVRRLGLGAEQDGALRDQLAAAIAPLGRVRTLEPMLAWRR